LERSYSHFIKTTRFYYSCCITNLPLGVRCCGVMYFNPNSVNTSSSVLILSTKSSFSPFLWWITLKIETLRFVLVTRTTLILFSDPLHLCQLLSWIVLSITCNLFVLPTYYNSKMSVINNSTHFLLNGEKWLVCASYQNLWLKSVLPVKVMSWQGTSSGAHKLQKNI
jgi:hypothetical protein